MLEHTVLCGSRAYPVRDPFFKMLKRSMNTFMNAMTGQVYTVYPFSTVVQKDYENLMNVYLDATFFPLLRRTDFMQEGHRLEFESKGKKEDGSGGVVGNGMDGNGRVKDSTIGSVQRDGKVMDGLGLNAGFGNLLNDSPATTLKIKRTGVVYNEMKGHMSDSASVFMTRLQKELHGDTPLGHCSGGDWRSIPELTYERLVDFHKTCYHPSNACFLSYGDLPLTKTLQNLEDKVLSKFTYDAKSFYGPLKEIEKSAKMYAMNQNIEMIVPADHDNDDKAKIVRTWTLDKHFDSRDHRKSTIASVLSSLLLDGAQSPVYTSLIDSQIAPQYGPGTGFDVNNICPTFSIGAQGMADPQAAEAAILAGLEKAALEGFSSERVNAVVFQMELGLRRKRSNFGLSCLYRAGQAWVTGGPENIVQSFEFSAVMKELKTTTPDFWKLLVKEWALDGWNNYSVRALAWPSKTLVKQEAEQEESDLETLQAKFAPGDVERITNENQRLAKERQAPEDVSLLPTLDVSKDVPLVTPEAIRVESAFGNASKTEIQRVMDQKTNGVSYIRGFFHTAELNNSKLTMLLPMLCSTLSHVDAGGYDYRALDLAVESVGGNLSFDMFAAPWLGPDDPTKKRQPTEEGIIVKFESLSADADKAFRQVLGDILSQSKFNCNDGKRVQSLLATSAESLTSSLPQHAHSYARLLSRAPHGRLFDLAELHGGLSHAQFIQRAAQSGVGGATQLADALQKVSSVVFSSASDPRSSFVSDDSLAMEGFEVVDGFMHRFPKNKTDFLKLEQEISASLTAAGLFTEQSSWPMKRSKATYLPMSVPVHYCHAALKTDVTYGHTDDAALAVLATIAKNDFLHQHIREKGGAYGAGCSFDDHGIFGLSSYWDPNSTQTLKTFEECIKWLCDANFSEKQVDEALLSIFGSLDAPSSPGHKGIDYFLRGVTAEMRDAKREKYFDLVGAQGIVKLRDVAQKHLLRQVMAGKESAEATSFLDFEKDERVSVCVAGNTDSAKAFQDLGWKLLVL